MCCWPAIGDCWDRSKRQSACLCWVGPRASSSRRCSASTEADHWDRQMYNRRNGFNAAGNRQRIICMVRDDGHESHLASRTAGGLAAIFPPIQWLPQYELSWLKLDAVAGVTLAAYAIP